MEHLRYGGGVEPRNARFIEFGADFANAIHGMPKEGLLSQQVRQQHRAVSAWAILNTTIQHSFTEVMALSASISVLYRPSVLYRLLSDGSVVTMGVTAVETEPSTLPHQRCFVSKTQSL